MNAYIWRTVNAAARYVCSYTGSDITGDGLSTNPFRSLTKAHTATHILTVNLTGASGGTGYTVNDVLTLATPSGGIAATVRVSTVNAGVVTAVVLTYRGVGYSVGVKATTGGTGSNCTVNVASVATTNSAIICRGLFSDDITGIHTHNIDADYYGAAVWDGQGLYNIYGFRHNNMIFLNSGSVPGYVGVGGAVVGGGGVGNTSDVIGLSGSPAFVDNCVLYFGIVGGVNINFAVYSRIKPNANYLVSLGSKDASPNQNITVYGIPKASMRKSITTSTVKGPNMKYSLLSATAIYLDQLGKFDTCMFAGDCTFWQTDTEFTPTGATDSDKMDSIIAKLATLGTTKLTLTNCRYTSQTASELFNNHLLQDFTLKNGSDAILDQEDVIYITGLFTYFGAMKPALNIPIMEDSSGVPGTWDENTATGCLSIAAGDIIQINESSPSALSQIFSKVIAINNKEMVLDGIKSLIIPKLDTNYYLEDRVMIDTTPIYELTELSVGRYKVCNYPLTYDGNIYYVGDTVYVSTTGTSFTDFDGNTAYLLEIDDPNFYNPVHVRQRRAIFSSVVVGGELQNGGVYLNYGNESITYRGRTIVSGESFMAENSEDSFSGTEGYYIGIMFDDTRVPSSEWIPALTFDDYFNGMNGASQVYDDESRPAGSGNPKSYVAPLLGTFGKQLLNYTYIQFKIMLRQYDVV